jgi:ubiquinone/menaquinone biosynthesis C-methylase UbiE
LENNFDAKTVAGFGDEWARFDQSDVGAEELQAAFDEYFNVFPWEMLPREAVGFDMGCGSGRWAKFVAGRVGRLYCVDASRAALTVAEKNLEKLENVEFINASFEDLPIERDSMDFGYSLGVLHHIPDTTVGIKSCADRLKPGAPFLLYIYYAFDNRPFWFRALWKLTDFARRILSRLPFQIRSMGAEIIAALIYYPLARTSLLVEKSGKDVRAFPLSWYRRKSFYAMRTDALDRFGTSLEKRYSKTQIQQMMESAGLERIVFSETTPHWCAVGFKAVSI